MILNKELLPQDGESLGKELEIAYYENSALTGNGIAQAFEFLAKDGNDGGINLDGGVTPKKKECCK